MRAPPIALDTIDVELLDEGVEVNIPIIQNDAAIRSVRGREDIAIFRLEVVLQTWDFYALPYSPDFSTVVSVCHTHAFGDGRREGEGLTGLGSTSKFSCELKIVVGKVLLLSAADSWWLDSFRYLLGGLGGRRVGEKSYSSSPLSTGLKNAVIR
jgi:hypothetical protein